MTNTKKKNGNKRKLLGAVGMLSVSAAMLVSSTFAWFTMNKTVKATSMEVKAHAEEGLLINEVAAHDSDTWDEQATGNTAATLISLRPASTHDLATFWHANSTKSYDEAGIGDDSANTALISEGQYYKNVTADSSGISDKTFVGAVGADPAGENGNATGNVKAETHVYYDHASFGDAAKAAYDDGEGYYVKYTYYLKSSSSTALSVKNLQVAVKATKKQTEPAGNSDNLDAALRVGVEYTGRTKIFAPITGADGTYSVTNNAAGSASTEVTAVTGTTGSFTEYATMNSKTDGTANLSIPAVTSDGTALYVYVWFEGEDDACMSDNLSTALAAYDIDISVKDADI